MTKRGVIEAQKFSALSITHRWHWLLIDVTDYSSMIHRLLIDYYTAHERHFSCFLVPHFFVCDSLICVRGIFPYIWSSRWRGWDAKCTNTNDSQLCNILLYPTLYLITKQQYWTVTNQSENETNKYAAKNRLRVYRFCFVCVCQQSKTASA